MENQEIVVEKKKRALSCIQPTGIPTLGNYLGALRNWVDMQNEFECAFAVADLHAITVRQEPVDHRCTGCVAAGVLISIPVMVWCGDEKMVSKAVDRFVGLLAAAAR